MSKAEVRIFRSQDSLNLQQYTCLGHATRHTIAYSEQLDGAKGFDLRHCLCQFLSFIKKQVLVGAWISPLSFKDNVETMHSPTHKDYAGSTPTCPISKPLQPPSTPIASQPIQPTTSLQNVSRAHTHHPQHHHLDHRHHPPTPPHRPTLVGPWQTPQTRPLRLPRCRIQSHTHDRNPTRSQLLQPLHGNGASADSAGDRDGD